MVHIFYHSADFDGKTSNEVVKRAFKGEEICEFPWTYGYSEPNFTSILREGDTVVIVDLSFSQGKMQELNYLHNTKQANVIWIDHHVSAIVKSQECGYDSLPGVRHIGEAACALAWRYFFIANVTPEEIEQIPNSILLFSAYDVWDKENPMYSWEVILAFQYGARANEQQVLKNLFTMDDTDIDMYVRGGRQILKYEKNRLQSAADKGHFFATIDEYKVVVINTQDFCSAAFESIDESLYDVMVPISFQSTGNWRVSLYTKNPDIDVSELASRFGGGGHRATAGFSLEAPDAIYLFHYGELNSKEYGK